MTTQINSEQVIRRLYQITCDHNKGFEHQVNELIQMGLERFGLDIGIFSKIEGSNYFVQDCITPKDVPMMPGDRFDYDATYCSITCSAMAPVAIEHVGSDKRFAVHPAYKAFGLESYIGVPIRLNDELYGTLNFSSPTPFFRKFLDIDIDALQLMASWIEVELIRREQEAELRKLNNKLKYQANYDSLTNIPNRRGMHRKLIKGMNHLNRMSGECTLAILDIDYFKKLNDVYGHQKGDEALVEIANKINDSLRDYEFVARLGGEEFMIWLPDTNSKGSSIVFKRVMKSISEIKVTSEPITVSIGSSHYKFSDNKQVNLTELIDDMMGKADKALYEAKQQGRNQFKHAEQ
ncbi:sensor domain-containing diguanylate cyclase [Shewanella olleyana]|uniref:sensor domain-containing diguanylate cyclase n=1 Tax=Shewanella olleyana TaxID=135626 RepID=UPI00200F88FC|nr:diguanylate cyclase [Shewanella olleyana]MCL1067942.1 sensor domain-containing diguanylate cyclase [Shewanella olleyana]